MKIDRSNRYRYRSEFTLLEVSEVDEWHHFIFRDGAGKEWTYGVLNPTDRWKALQVGETVALSVKVQAEPPEVKDGPFENRGRFNSPRRLGSSGKETTRSPRNVSLTSETWTQLKSIARGQGLLSSRGTPSRSQAIEMLAKTYKGTDA